MSLQTVPDPKNKDVNRSATYRQPWTPEEQVGIIRGASPLPAVTVCMFL